MHQKMALCLVPGSWLLENTPLWVGRPENWSTCRTETETGPGSGPWAFVPFCCFCWCCCCCMKNNIEHVSGGNQVHCHYNLLPRISTLFSPISCCFFFFGNEFWLLLAGEVHPYPFQGAVTPFPLVIDLTREGLSGKVCVEWSVPPSLRGNCRLLPPPFHASTLALDRQGVRESQWGRKLAQLFLFRSFLPGFTQMYNQHYKVKTKFQQTDCPEAILIDILQREKKINNLELENQSLIYFN